MHTTHLTVRLHAIMWSGRTVCAMAYGAREHGRTHDRRTHVEWLRNGVLQVLVDCKLSVTKLAGLKSGMARKM
jgi:hypothetical protein